MGWRFRKSKKVGPFRITASKSGIGVSVGVPGARIGVGADGRVRTTAGIRGTGISYQSTHGGHRHHAASAGSGYGYQPGYGAPRPPPRSTSGALVALLAVVGVIMLGFGACVCVALVGGSRSASRATAQATADDLSAPVTAACERLQRAGFADHCGDPQLQAGRATLDFPLRESFNGDEGRVTLTAGDASAPVAVAPEPGFVRFAVASAKTHLRIEIVSASDGGRSEWVGCLAKGGGPVRGLDGCKKKLARQIARYHAFHDYAQRIVDGTAEGNSTCTFGYLCGTTCTSDGDTCCIDVGKPDTSCSRDDYCTRDGNCISTAPAPFVPAGGGGGGGGCTCGDGTSGCCGRGCCSHHGGVAR